MRRPSAPLVAACIATLLTSAPAARAQDATGVATDLFNAGRDLMKVGDYRMACPKLAESARLEAKVGTLARLAECEEKLGHMVSARARWEQAVNVATSQHDDRLSHVQGELSRVDKLVPKLSFSIAGQPPSDLAIRIDELQVGLGSLGVPLPVEAGAHHVVASAAGKTPWSANLVTTANGVVTDVKVPALIDAPPVLAIGAAAPLSHDVAAPSSASSTSPVRTIGIVTAAAGIVGVGVGAAFGLIAGHKNSESNAQPGGCDANNVCPGPADALRNDARTAGDVSTAFFVAGGALIAGGVVMWLTAPKSGASSSVGLAPLVGPSATGFILRGAF